MPPKPRLFAPVEALVVATMLLTIVSGTLAASKYKVLHAFTGGNDGGGLYSGLLLDQEGNVYGETVAGGPKGKGGTAFRLEHQANGKWAEAVLYNFCSEPECRDGGGPMGGLIFDPEGSLYGTTEGGGGPYKYGTVFELTPGTHGWTETVLRRFSQQDYGSDPQSALAMDAAGNLYGTAPASAFELTPGSHGWKETILHEFTGQNGDGFGAYAGVIKEGEGVSSTKQ